MDWQKEDLKYIWHPCSQMKDYETLAPIVIESGKGINLYDINGKCYKDVISSWWCNLLGHCHPRINAAIKKQVDTLEHVIFANFSHKTAITLCQKLMEDLPEKSADIIERHMWPAGHSKMPNSLEGVIVSAADKYAAVKDLICGSEIKHTGIRNTIRSCLDRTSQLTR